MSEANMRMWRWLTSIRDSFYYYQRRKYAVKMTKAYLRERGELDLPSDVAYGMFLGLYDHQHNRTYPIETLWDGLE